MIDINSEKIILKEVLNLFKEKQYAEVEKKALSYMKPSQIILPYIILLEHHRIIW